MRTKTGFRILTLAALCLLLAACAARGPAPDGEPASGETAKAFPFMGLPTHADVDTVRQAILDSDLGLEIHLERSAPYNAVDFRGFDLKKHPEMQHVLDELARTDKLMPIDQTLHLLASRGGKDSPVLTLYFVTSKLTGKVLCFEGTTKPDNQQWNREQFSRLKDVAEIADRAYVVDDDEDRTTFRSDNGFYSLSTYDGLGASRSFAFYLDNLQEHFAAVDARSATP